MAKEYFYAVRIGKKPGIYKTWDECKEQVLRYHGSIYKKFTTLEEAEVFVADPSTTYEKKSTKQIDLPDGAYAFIDGSYNPSTECFGYGGFLCFNGKKYPISGYSYDPELSNLRNVAGEVRGIVAIVKIAEQLGIDEITVFYDYIGIEKWVTGEWTTNRRCTREYANFMNHHMRKIKVIFQKVDAHSGIEGNELADLLAKQAVGVKLTYSQEQLLRKTFDEPIYRSYIV